MWTADAKTHAHAGHEIGWVKGIILSSYVNVK